MRYDFVKNTLENLIKKGLIHKKDSILAVCSGIAERNLFHHMNFKSVTISSLDERMTKEDVDPFHWKFENVQQLSFGDDSFEYVFVSDGLHHCNFPHAALLEMYRVARKGIIVFESRDSLLMRLANLLKLSPEYEIEAVISHDFQYGGVNNTYIPNYIYRWTEREFEKVIQSNQPTARQSFHYFYGLNLPFSQAKMKKRKFKYYILCLIGPFVSAFSKLFKKQCNSFCMMALKPKIPHDLMPWLKFKNNEIKFNKNYAKQHFNIK